MSKNKDQILLENIYSDIRKNIQSSSTDDMGRDLETGSFDDNFNNQEGDDYDRAEQLLDKALNFNEVDHDSYMRAVEKIVATMHHSPEEIDDCVEGCAAELQNNGEQPMHRDDFSEERPFGYESSSILTAYNKVISEAQKKSKGKVNPYAVCTKTVGRKDESKYKKCKDGVEKGAKKSGKTITNEPVK